MKMEARVTRRTLLGSVGAAALFPPVAAALGSMPVSMPRLALEARLHLGAPQTSIGGRRRAVVHGGAVTGRLMHGTVQSGMLEWLVDPASGAVDLAARLQVLRTDGVLVELRDRTAHAGADRCASLPGWPTAPQLFEAASGRPITTLPLTGRLDTTSLGRGVVGLRAFYPA
jgi:hypothetical protein